MKREYKYLEKPYQANIPLGKPPCTFILFNKFILKEDNRNNISLKKDEKVDENVLSTHSFA